MQTCIVHEIRSSTRYVNYRDRKPVARDLRSVYTAANAEQALAALERFDERWGAQYPMIARMWRRDWEYIIPFLSLPQPLRRVVRKAIKTRGAFPDEQAATKLIYLAILRAEAKWRRVQSWTPALAALKIHFEDRLPD